MKNLTPEMIEKAKAAKSSEELLDIAKECEVEMTAEEAATYFAQLNPKSGELDDDELDSVAGGSCSTKDEYPYYDSVVRITSGQICPRCKSDTGYIVNTVSTGKPRKGIACHLCKKGVSGGKIMVYDINDCTFEVIGMR